MASMEMTFNDYSGLLSYFEDWGEIPSGNLTCAYLLFLNDSEAVKISIIVKIIQKNNNQNNLSK